MSKLSKIVNVLNDVYQRTVNDRKANQEAFFKIYRSLIDNIDPKLAKDIGNLAASNFVRTSAQQRYNIELTMSDYLWWVNVVKRQKVVFYDEETITSSFIAGILDKADKLNLNMSSEDVKALMKIQLDEDVDDE